MRKIFVSLIAILVVIVVTCTTIHGTVNTTATNSPPQLQLVNDTGGSLNNLFCKDAQELVINMPLKYPLISPTQTNLLSDEATEICNLLGKNNKEMANSPLIVCNLVTTNTTKPAANREITILKNSGFKYDMLKNVPVGANTAKKLTLTS